MRNLTNFRENLAIFVSRKNERKHFRANPSTKVIEGNTPGTKMKEVWAAYRDVGIPVVEEGVEGNAQSATQAHQCRQVATHHLCIQHWKESM